VKILGFQISKVETKQYSDVPSTGFWSGFVGQVLEPFAGAWQRNIQVDTLENNLAFSAVYACVSLIANDIAKLRIKLTRREPSGVWTEVSGSPFSRALVKPNRYQTRIQFLCHWMTCKLLHGNAYALKERDQRGMVSNLYLLDPRSVRPLVADDGAVYYRINGDKLAGVADTGIVVPASEIIHDRMVTLWHPLVGVTPIYACGAASTQGRRIQANSARFFENQSQPGGILTAPGKIDNDVALRLKTDFERDFSGSNRGRILVAGNGLKYEAVTIAANDSQLIEQLRWTVEDVARCFHVPLHKIQAGSDPSHTNIAALNQDYYSQTLQAHIEALEILLDEGLELPADYGTELDLDALLRMDPSTRFDAYTKGVTGMWLAPNEARKAENLEPVPGGDSPLAQQQNWTLAQLEQRPPPTSAPAIAPPVQDPPSNDPAKPDTNASKALADALIAKFTEAAHA
jgi:HK97 family phage portal protein